MEEFQAHTLRDRAGRPFDQLRRVTLGSNWPSNQVGQAPRPGVVAIQRRDGTPF
jgi:secreted PhoX family phosphatase